MSNARSTLEGGVSTARSTLMEGIGAVNGVVSLLRNLHLNDALGWVGLSRRRSPFESVAVFGAGVLVGTGVGMLFAPKSGADLRRMIFGKLQGIEKDAERVVNQAGTQVKETVKDIETKAKDIENKIENKADDLAGKAKGALSTAENKADDMAAKAKSAILNTERKAEDLAGKAKDAVTGADAKADNDYNKNKDYTANPRTVHSH